MMDDRHTYEKLSIRDSARSSKKYGSTSNRNNTRNESYIKHYVGKSDTLQGIALKYGVTMEQIRRANRLFASDSLFLREFLLIPTTETTPTSPEQEPEPAGSSREPPSDASSRVTSPVDDIDCNDFLVRIDAAIASTKEGVKKIHKQSEFGEFSNERRKPAVSRLRQMQNNNGTCDIVKMPQTVVMTQGNKIKTSMQRYQQQQDELFEL